MKNSLFDFDGFLAHYAGKSIFELSAARRTIIQERWDHERVFGKSDDYFDLSDFDHQIELKLLGKLIFQKRLEQDTPCPNCGYLCPLTMRICKRCGNAVKDSIAKQIEMAVFRTWSDFDWDSGVSIKDASPYAVHLFFSHRDFFYIPVTKSFYGVSKGNWRNETVFERITKDELIDIVNIQLASASDAGVEDEIAYWESNLWNLKIGNQLSE